MPTACLEIRQLPFMPQKQSPQKGTTPFGSWLREARAQRGLTAEALAEKAEVTQPMISNLERGMRNPSRDMVARLARGLVPEDADEHVAVALLNAGLRAAAFLPNDQSFTRELSPEAIRLAEVYNGAEEEGRNLLDAAADMISRAQSQDSIGRNADDFGKRIDDLE